MRKFFFLLFFSFFASFLYAQSDDDVVLRDIQDAYEACILFRDAAASGDTSAIRQSADSLRAASLGDFRTLDGGERDRSSLDGHLVFNVDFADSLAAGKNVWEKASDIEESSVTRGQYTDGKVHSKTCFVKAGKSVKYSFQSKGYQELAVVAEAGGLVTMRIHVTNRAGLDERHDDTKYVDVGRPHRKASFNLPTSYSNTVELEIINRSNKDCSFVVISN